MMIIENLSIKVEVSPGTSIAQACREATALANHLRLTVDFKFNEVTVMTKPGVDPEELEKAWKQEMTCPQYDIPCPFWSPAGNCVGTLEHCRGRKKK